MADRLRCGAGVSQSKIKNQKSKILMARWNSCNVLHVGAAARRVWQFDARSAGFNLKREQVSRAGEPLPSKLIGKGWTSLWQPKLNVAWLPPEEVFIRVAQFPLSTPEETRAMVELQLEKLSPIPVTQAVWTMHILPGSSAPRHPQAEGAKTENLQTVVVVLVARSVVEQFLGQLEGQGYQADRLELPLIDQLEATPVSEDGAWIYPETQGGNHTALVAWWYGGVLHTVDLLTLSAGPDRAQSLKDHLMQMAWAGELGGWLTAPPRWHLVADDATAAEWLAPLREGLEQTIEVVPPLSGPELAARTAKRATLAGAETNLLPPEFAARYKRQFEDRLWMRGLLWLVAAYVAGVMAYFIAVSFVSYQTTAAENRVAQQGLSYTNSIEIKAQYKILKDRNELQFAALDCWQAVAEAAPENVTLDAMNFSAGRKLALNGTAIGKETTPVTDFGERLRKHVLTEPPNQGQLLFKQNADIPTYNFLNNGTIRWNYNLELARTEKL
jgi:hypothetical protein